MPFTEQLKQAAREAGADLVGIASIDRFDEVAQEHHPCSIFPEAQSVIVIGKRIARGCLRGVEEGTQFTLYDQFAMTWVPDRFLALTTVTTATFLEDNRWEAVPLPCLPATAPAMGVAVREDVPPPNVMLDFADAAVRAGLGLVAYSGELFTPEFGPRQRFQVILTDAELEADPLCEQAACDYCGKCVTACPLGAMKTDAEREVSICGMSMRVAHTEWDTCRGCRNGAVANRLHPTGLPDRVSAACLRRCVHHLDEAGLVSNRFAEPFRKRPPWQIDAAGRASVPEEA